MTGEGSRSVRVGVVGVGAVGRHHVRLYSQLAGVDLVAVYDINASRAREIASQYGVSAARSLEELASLVDAASVAVPADRHFEVSLPLLKRGVHLLVEKPIATDTAEAERMVAAAQQRNVILQVGHVERFNPVLSYLEENAPNPKFIEAHRLAPYPPPRRDGRPRGTEVSVVLDLMIHDLEIILHLVRSEVVRLDAVGVPVLSDSEDIANVRIAFRNGCIANVTASRISPERMRKIRVFLEDTYISLDYEKQVGELFRKVRGQILREPVPLEKEEPLLRELRSFVRCVADRSRPVVPAEHAAEALRLACRIVAAIREHRP